MPRRKTTSQTKSKIDPRQIAVYVRKSKITETGKSIDIQKEKCIKKACDRFDLDESQISICEVASATSRTDLDNADILVYEDEGKSGFYADRPLYKELLRDIENNKLKAVICFKIDRISRKTVDFLNLAQLMEQRKIAFISVSDNDIDINSKTGKIMVAILGAIAEFERDIIAERIRENMYELAKEGRWLGGICPLGYKSKKVKLDVEGRKKTINHLEPIKEEQRTVKRIFELFMEMSSLSGVAKKLNEEGYKTGTGIGFTNVAVKGILENPVYAIADEDIKAYFTTFEVPIWAEEESFDGKRGIIAYNKTEQTKTLDDDSRILEPKYNQQTTRRDITEWIVSVGKHKGLISGAEWIRVQSIVEDISYNQSARPKESSKALLSGLLKCHLCGSPMYVRTESKRFNPDGSKQYNYACKLKRDSNKTCESGYVSGYFIDNFVIEQICSMNTDKNTLYAELINTRNTMSIRLRETEREQTALNKRISQIEKEIQNQAKTLRTAPEIVKKTLLEDIETLSLERETSKNRLDIIIETARSQDNQLADIEKAKQTILDFPKLINLVDYEGKLQLLRRILECVIVKDNTAHIFFKGSDDSSFFVKEQERSDVCYTDQFSIFDTAYRIRSQAGPFVRLVGCYGFYQPYGTHRYEVFVFFGVVIVFLGDIGHQTQVVFYEYVFGIVTAFGVFFQVLLFRIGSQGRWEGVAPRQVSKQKKAL